MPPLSPPNTTAPNLQIVTAPMTADAGNEQKVQADPRRNLILDPNALRRARQIELGMGETPQTANFSNVYTPRSTDIVSPQSNNVQSQRSSRVQSPASGQVLSPRTYRVESAESVYMQKTDVAAGIPEQEERKMEDVREGQEERIVMSSTSYPGQGWDPSQGWEHY